MYDNSKKMLVGIGEVLWDDYGDRRTLGGAVANVAVHAARFGIDSWVISAIGKDEDGIRAKNELQSRGVCTHFAYSEHPTGSVAVKVGENGENRYDIRYPAAWDFIPFTEELALLARKTDAVCFGTLAQRSEQSRETIMRFLEEMSSGGRTLRMFDVNLREGCYSDAVVRRSMSLCNMLKISDSEYPYIRSVFGLDERPEVGCAQLLRGFSLKAVLLTSGADGSRVLTPEGAHFLPAERVEVADSVGAGDSFTAAFISSILKGANVCEAHGRAARTAAYVCSQCGATPVLPSSLTK